MPIIQIKKGRVSLVYPPVITLRIQFDSAPSNPSVSFADMKYNKSMGILWTKDDGVVGEYTYMFPYLNGGTDIGGTVHAGVKGTDGCGKEITYKANLAANGGDDHNVAGGDPNVTNWTQYAAMVAAGWSISNHSFSHGGYDIMYQIKQNELRFYKEIGYRTRTVTVPSNDEGYSDSTFQLAGYPLVTSQYGGIANENNRPELKWGGVKSNDINPNKMLLPRDFNGDNFSEGTGLIEWWKGNVDTWFTKSHGATAADKYMFSGFSHGPGNQAEITGFKQFIDYVRDHPNNNDRLWFASYDEFIDYYRTKAQVVKSQILTGSTLEVTLDMANIDKFTFIRDMSLLVNANANITNITATGIDDFTFNPTTKLINVYKKISAIPDPRLDPVPPRITSVTPSGSTLIITYDKDITQSLYGGYTVTNNTVTGISGSGTTWTLQLQNTWASGQNLYYRMFNGDAKDANGDLKVCSYNNIQVPLSGAQALLTF